MKYFGLIDEHKLIFQNHYKLKRVNKITSENKLLDLLNIEESNLLFYHWYERRYNTCVIKNEILYTLNINSIIDFYKKYSKKEIIKDIN